MLMHLLELRRRAMITLLCFMGLFLLFFIKSQSLFHWLVQPLLQALPNQDGLIATQLTSTVFTPIQLAFNFALLCSTPLALYQLWQFIAPGLYTREKQGLRTAVFLSLFLFLTGVLFCFYVVLPFMFQFFAQAIPPGVKLMPDMVNTLSFITYMLILFGLCFQVPLLAWTLVRTGLITVAILKMIRPYVIVAAFILGMLLTPPDVFSQVMLALPLCLLYELGIVMASWLRP